MPNYQKHLLGGCLMYTALIYTSSKLSSKPTIIFQLQALIACLVGALFPDVDTKSKIQKLIYLAILAATVTLLLSGRHFFASILVMLSLLPLITNHRGLFHRLWFVAMCVGIGNVFCLVNQPNWVNDCLSISGFFLAGVVSHLWLDLGFRRLF